MLKINIGEYVRFAFKWSVLTSILLILIAWATGAIMA
jgi:citrate-Mg2+:H+ or citrate-Ca2+:H+ symporter, CitMHS family